MLTNKTASTNLVTPIQLIKTQIGLLNPYDLHKRLVNNYLLCKKGETNKLKRDDSKDKRDIDIIRENHKFLWDEDDTPESWEARLAKKYYDKLFKEYCICDLSRYKENKIAMRWRIEEELVIGKGQFICGEKRCHESKELKSWEVNFAYIEGGIKKNALVKARLCPGCSRKLNYHQMKREAKRIKKRKRLSNELNKNEPEKNQNKKMKNNVESPSTSQDDNNEQDESNNKNEDSGNIWKQENFNKEKTREQEFDEYLEDLFL